MHSKPFVGICLLFLLAPSAIGAQHQLAGLEIRDFKLDAANGRMAFSLANTTEKWITAWAWSVLDSDAEEGRGIRWFDNYDGVDFPGITSTRPASATRIRPGEIREISEPLPDNARDISLLAVIFEDMTAYGEASVLDLLESGRQEDITVNETLISEVAKVRALSNPVEALGQSIERLAPAPQNKNRREVRIRARLEQLRNNLKFRRAVAPVLEAEETIAKAQLERAKGQAHFRRMK